MRNIFTIGNNDLRVFLRDRSAFIWLLGMPLAFVLFTSFSSRPRGDPWEFKPKVVVENQDAGFMGGVFAAELSRQGLWVVTPEEEPDAARGIIIPENFTAQVLGKEKVAASFFTVPGSGNEQESILAKTNLFRAVVAFNSYLVENATATGGRNPTEESLRKLMDAENPVVLDASFAGRKPIPVGFNMSLPGILVMYLFINLAIFGGSGIAAERRSGVLRRMSINPVKTPQLMLGKLYGLILLAGVQVGFFMILGQFVFDVNIGENLFGISVTLFVFSWLSASIGLLLGFVLKSEEKIIGLALLVGIPMAAIGGCWFPMEIAPEFVRRISYFFPTAWAMDSLHQLITFGSGFSGVLKQVGVLAAYAIGANLIAVRFFRV
jgi:ABC-type multidrug transport system permease subunit